MEEDRPVIRAELNGRIRELLEELHALMKKFTLEVREEPDGAFAYSWQACDDARLAEDLHGRLCALKVESDQHGYFSWDRVLEGLINWCKEARKRDTQEFLQLCQRLACRRMAARLPVVSRCLENGNGQLQAQLCQLLLLRRQRSLIVQHVQRFRNTAKDFRLNVDDDDDEGEEWKYA